MGKKNNISLFTILGLAHTVIMMVCTHGSNKNKKKLKAKKVSHCHVIYSYYCQYSVGVIINNRISSQYNEIWWEIIKIALKNKYYKTGDLKTSKHHFLTWRKNVTKEWHSGILQNQC